MNRAQFDDLLGPGQAESFVTVDGDLIDYILAALDIDGTPLGVSVREQTVDELRRLSGESFELRAGDWRIDVRKSVLQATIASALMIACINFLGEGSIPLEVLAIILPFLVDVDRIELSTSDRYVLAQLQLHNLQPDTVKAWWKTLPKRLREEMNYLEFLDLIDRLHEAGAVKFEEDGAVKLTPDRPWLSLGWK